MDKISYALGMSVAQQLLNSGVKELNIDDFKTGVSDMFTGKKCELSPDEANKVMKNYFTKMEKNEKSNAKKEGEEYLSQNAKKSGVITTKSGLQYEVLVEGTGKQPGPHSRVRCHYEGKLINGQVFDSSYKRNQPAVFGLDQVISGWTEGLQLMNEGGKYLFTIPANLGYGENGIPGTIPGNSVLIFTVELMNVL